uniref:Homing endonuclease LAGLIDADG domain-containing protein n=1 Tax=Wickerhamomyces mucosus TaxID=1378264 RepID=S5TP08_9ASCO|nr:hypothetical protein [Wickerhamomyces mucosus]AGS44520.1 hypothetical protein [Wickerhamomyces mucosus]
MGFERSYQTNIPSNLKLEKLDPNFLTGLTDAEGCFSIKIGKRTQLEFNITLHSIDDELIKLVHEYFNCGNYRSYANKSVFSVVSIKDMKKIIDHFDNYPLLTDKQADYLLFREGYINKINKVRDIEKYLALSASINWGLSEKLKKEYPNIIPATRPIIEVNPSIHPMWISGFVTGDGSFLIRTTMESNKEYIKYIRPAFEITQHVRSNKLLNLLKNKFNCGNVVNNSDRCDHYGVYNIT